MTERTIVTCVRRWQKRLRLQDWEITVDLDVAPLGGEHALAECDRSGDYLEARLRFAANWRTWTPRACQLPDHDHNLEAKSLDRVVVHELLHVLTHDLVRASRLEYGLLTQAVDRMHDAGVDSQLERVVEKLAAIFVEAYA